MKRARTWIQWAIPCFVLVYACSLALGQTGPTVASAVLSPSTIAGGSGGTATGTVTLNSLAPAGGVLVSLSSSNTSLAASRPSVLVPEGAASATFAVATNKLYRRYSGLAFTATITASANGSSASASLSVTAQPRPADINGDSSQRQGAVCGGSFPASAGEPGILYQCAKAPNFGTVGKCTFKQECLSFGCLSRQASGFDFNDACATSGPFPVAVSPAYLESGNAAQGTLLLASAAPSSSDAMVRAGNSQTTAFPTGFFPITTGATNASFRVATSILPSIEFSSVGANIEIPVPISGGGTFLSHRLGLTWLAMTPPNPPPAQPIPTLGQVSVDIDPVIGGNNSLVSIWLSAVSTSGGPTIVMTSNNPQVASVPPSVTIPPGSNVENVTIATSPVASTTTVTITGTEGPRSLSDTLTVQASSCTPTTCAAQGKNCGSIPDGCGGTLTCGTCSAPQTCGGGGTPNVCGATCTPTTCAAQGKNCGSISDGCGGTLTCGTCGSGQTCTNNVCVSGGSVTLSSLTLSPTSVSGGDDSRGTVTLTATASANTTVNLSSSNSSVASVPSTVTVAAGARSATFTIRTNRVSNSTSVTITGSQGGVTKTATLTVTDGGRH